MQKVARAFLRARKAVPMRAHPKVPQTGGMAQKVAGMQAGLMDQMVETLGRREYAPLKYSHPNI